MVVSREEGFSILERLAELPSGTLKWEVAVLPAYQ
jgi:hypothetical protein